MSLCKSSGGPALFEGLMWVRQVLALTKGVYSLLRSFALVHLIIRKADPRLRALNWDFIFLSKPLINQLTPLAVSNRHISSFIGGNERKCILIIGISLYILVTKTSAQCYACIAVCDCLFFVFYALWYCYCSAISLALPALNFSPAPQASGHQFWIPAQYAEWELGKIGITCFHTQLHLKAVPMRYRYRNFWNILEFSNQIKERFHMLF